MRDGWGRGDGAPGAARRQAQRVSSSMATTLIDATRTIPESGVSRTTKWVIALFFVVLFIPGSINIGIRLDLYRIYLLVMAVPMALRILDDRTFRLHAVDVLVFLAVFWRALSLVANHQMEEVVNAGSVFVELFLGYMLGRVYIRSAADYRYFFTCFLLTLVAFLPFALLEAVLRKRFLSRLAGLILTQPPEEFGDQIRFGLMRVQVAFEHALLFGAFCAIGFANLFYIFANRFPRNLIYSGFAGFMTMLALSSSSMLTIALQIGLIAYEKVFRPIGSKWLVLAVTLIPGWFVFQMIAGMNFIDFVASRLVINPYVGEGRKEIFYYGMLEAYRHPVFGIGKDDWARPFWRVHPTADNFWVASAMRYGFPHVIFLLLAFVVQLLRTSLAGGLDAFEGACRRGYGIALFSLVLMLGTFGLWGVANTFVMLYLASGTWIYDKAAPAPRRRAAAPPRRPDGARAAATARRGAA